MFIGECGERLLCPNSSSFFITSTHKSYYIHYILLALKDAGIGGINYHFSHYQSHPTWIPQAQQLGLWTGVWTVNDPALMSDFLNQKVVVTTDNVFQENIK